MLSNPAPGRPVTSPYGYRIHPISKVRRLHRGTDYGGTFDVLAASDGVVTHIGWSPRGGGHVVKIDHGDCVTVYYHGRERTHLRKRDRVRTGDKVYVSGSTGASTGPHLHFEVRGPSGIWGTDQDPTPWFASNQSPKLKITGRLDKPTVRAWQRAVKAGGFNPGRIDGILGPMTRRAIQASLHVKTDGIFGPLTKKALQHRLRVKTDGVWGRITISTLQRVLNEGKY